MKGEVAFIHEDWMTTRCYRGHLSDEEAKEALKCDGRPLSYAVRAHGYVRFMPDHSGEYSCIARVCGKGRGATPMTMIGKKILVQPEARTHEWDVYPEGENQVKAVRGVIKDEARVCPPCEGLRCIDCKTLRGE